MEKKKKTLKDSAKGNTNKKQQERDIEQARFKSSKLFQFAILPVVALLESFYLRKAL